MSVKNLTEAFKSGRDKQQRAIFASLFILSNRLQTSFDKVDPFITMKQFMVLVMIKQAPDKTLDLTSCGELLGCSRQNIKKLAIVLESKKLIMISRNSNDRRRTNLALTAKGEEYFQSVAQLHSKALGIIFEEYTDQELELFFSIFMKLYDGTEKLEATENKILKEEIE
ncbi:MarR family winged helix-turn-helix transcriptional regulator [Enterococcus sp. AZ196]|uniref:MarR family winged helix-turn-helix transcriptional regulator n=1 Tax=Enterococcus sp. AZ196 TaxID=2774659 RepID=UPI003D2BCC1E